jgi:hypothetical protein
MAVDRSGFGNDRLAQHLLCLAAAHILIGLPINFFMLPR